MNIRECIIAMMAGYKVKLPEWTGYWFIPEGKRITTPLPENEQQFYNDISVLTKDGDIITTAWVDKYKDRDDFATTEGDLGFDFAILALKNGKKLARKSWGESIKWVRRLDLYTDKEFTVVEHEPCEGTLYPTFAKLNKENALELGWRPSASDMVATDWYLVMQ